MPEKQKNPEKTDSPSVGLSDLLATVRERLAEFVRSEDRLNFMKDLTEGYCLHCGFYDGDSTRGCQCWNDE